MESSIDEVVLHNCEEHPDVVLGEGVLAEVLSCGGVEGGAVVVADVVVDGDRSHLHHGGKPVHLPDTFLTGEPEIIVLSIMCERRCYVQRYNFEGF